MSEWAETARTRQGLYRFFGEALLSPSQVRSELLAGALLLLDQRDLDRFAFSLEWRHLGQHFPLEIREEKLDVEYVRLFASGMSGALSPPTESYYRVPAKGGGIAAFVADLQREYRGMGLAAVSVDEAPDHLSTELGVMSVLCGLEADAWEAGQEVLAGDLMEKESQFLRRHLVTWVPAFRKRVIAAGPSAFYGDLVNAVHSFVVHDNDFVAVLIDGAPSI